MARHRRKATTHPATKAVTVAATTSGALTLGAINAHIAAADQWDTVAACESTSNWHINTGNSFYGGLQFTLSTWREFGGLAFAQRADLATPEQQKLLLSEETHVAVLLNCRFTRDKISYGIGNE